LCQTPITPVVRTERRPFVKSKNFAKIYKYSTSILNSEYLNICFYLKIIFLKKLFIKKNDLKSRMRRRIALLSARTEQRRVSQRRIL